MTNSRKPFVRRARRGATMVEYAIMLAFIAVVVVGAVAIIGTRTDGLLTSAGIGW
jgi:Flp pilus assembly pilin Flp